MSQSPHIAVLTNEIVSSFKDIKDATIIDCTLGFGGHSAAILEALPSVKIIAFDRDEMAIDFCKNRFKNEPRIQIYHANFSSIARLIDGIKIGGILADIGVSSLQLDLDERGFNLNSERLDMRMNQREKLTAQKIVNEYSQSELERVLKEFGELPNAKSVATKIILARSKSPITSARELASIIGSFKLLGRQINSAILLFQALRIEVNDELGELLELLKFIKTAADDARFICGATISIISFHSLEDRLVKNAFKEYSQNCICDPRALKCSCAQNHAIGKIVNKKPITASPAEIAANPRSSCAKLRSFRIFNDR